MTRVRTLVVDVTMSFASPPFELSEKMREQEILIMARSAPIRVVVASLILRIRFRVLDSEMEDPESQVSYRFLVSEFSTLILARRRYFLPPEKGVLKTDGK